LAKQEQTNKWLTLIAMTGSLSMIFIDQTVVSVALPVMQRDFAISQTGLQWIVNAYVLALAATVALGGRLGDVYGRVHAFVVGVILFAVASTVCGLAPNEFVLIGARVFQGVAAALMIPSSAAIVIDSFDIHERGKAMAIYVGVAQAFLAVGPLLGGFLTEYLSWRWVFWINIPVGALAIILTFISKPQETRTKGQSRTRVLRDDAYLRYGGVCFWNSAGSYTGMDFSTHTRNYFWWIYSSRPILLLSDQEREPSYTNTVV